MEETKEEKKRGAKQLVGYSLIGLSVILFILSIFAFLTSGGMAFCCLGVPIGALIYGIYLVKSGEKPRHI